MFRRLSNVALIIVSLTLISAPPLFAGSNKHHHSGHKSGYYSGGHHKHYGYHSHHRYSYGYRYYRPFYFGVSYGYPYPYFYGAPYTYYNGVGVSSYPASFRFQGSYHRSYYGGIDLEVKPKKAEIYLNGNYVGNSGNFDGWPGYLWLREDSYTLTIAKEGYAPTSREITVVPGSIVKLRETLFPGGSEGAAMDQAATRTSDLYHDGYGFTAREPESSVAHERTPPPAEEPQWQPDRGSDPPATSGAFDVRQEPGKLTLDVQPADAVVYLDDRYLGIAAEIGAQEVLLIEPGHHRLEVMRPGYPNRKVDFEAAAGEKVELRIQLSDGSV